MSEERSRFFLDKSNPAIWRGLNTFAGKVNQAAEEVGLSRATLEMMYVRISQINGCAFCLDVHSRGAVKAGIPQDLLALIPAWEETAAFTDEERAAFAIGEVVTELPEVNQRRVTLQWAQSIVGDEKFGVLQWAAIAMNSYNRVSILSEHPAKNPRA